jgi:hypothetical protein
MILDPEGLIFPGKYDFDKFFELARKQRKIFNQRIQEYVFPQHP